MGASYPGWSWCTHGDALTRDPGLAPAPGMDLRSRDSRRSRIYALDPAIRSGTESESRPPSAGDVGYRLERPCRAEGALSMRAPEDVVEIGHFRIPTDHGAVRCARRTVFTHHEKLTSEPALAPAPGKGLRSRESRATRIYRLDPALTSVTYAWNRASFAGTSEASLRALFFALKAHF